MEPSSHDAAPLSDAELLARLQHLDAPSIDLEAGWHAVAARLDQTSVSSPAVAPRPRSRLGDTHRSTPASPLRRWGVAIGAVATTAFVAAFVAVFTTMHRSSGDEGGDLAVVREYAAGAGQYATIDLPDGSRVVLNPRARLRFAMDPKGARIARLDGRAYFTVTHEPTRPFVVQGSVGRVRVLGTSFGVAISNAEARRSLYVEVMDGRVAIEGGRKATKNTPVVLSAGQTAFSTDSTVTTATSSGGVQAAWTQGVLEFQDAPVPVVLETLSRWSGYQFQLTDSALRSAHVTAAFTADRPAEMLAALKNLLNVQMVFERDTVVLHPNSAAPSRRARPRDSFRVPSPSTGRSVPNASEVGK